ncbi:hypothetical protein ACU686_39580 [Yinghuangia aomiensis]
MTTTDHLSPGELLAVAEAAFGGPPQVRATPAASTARAPGPGRRPSAPTPTRTCGRRPPH